MSDKIADAIRLLVEDGAEVTYSRTSDFEVPEFLKETYRLQERERIIKLLEPEVARHYELGLDASAAYLEQTITLIKGKQE